MNKLLQPMIDRVQASYRSWKYKENKYFKILTDTDHNGIMAIELIDGPFKGIIYSYGSINIGEDLGFLGCNATFDIDIIKGPQNITEDTRFCKIVGNILLVVLEEAVSNMADKYFKDNLDEENREDYFEEPLPKRTVRSKDSSVPKKRISSRKSGKNPSRRNPKVRSKVQQDPDA